MKRMVVVAACIVTVLPKGQRRTRVDASVKSGGGKGTSVDLTDHTTKIE